MSCCRFENPVTSFCVACRLQQQCSRPADEEPVNEGCEDAADCAGSDGLSVGSSLDAPETATDSDGSDSEEHACSDSELKARLCARRAAASHDRWAGCSAGCKGARVCHEGRHRYLPFCSGAWGAGGPGNAPGELQPHMSAGQAKVRTLAVGHSGRRSCIIRGSLSPWDYSLRECSSFEQALCQARCG